MSLSDKIEWVDDFYIREEKDTHPATKTPILNVSDVNEAVKKLLKELDSGLFTYEYIHKTIKSIFGERLCE